MCFILFPLFLVPLCVGFPIFIGGWSGLYILIRGSCLNLTILLTFVSFFLLSLCFSWYIYWYSFGYVFWVMSGWSRQCLVGDHLRSLPHLLSYVFCLCLSYSGDLVLSRLFLLCSLRLFSYVSSLSGVLFCRSALFLSWYVGLCLLASLALSSFLCVDVDGVDVC